MTFRSAYTVQEGDTLTLIANAFKTTVDAIKTSNGLSSDIVRVGQELIIDAAEPARISGPLRRKTTTSKASDPTVDKGTNKRTETGEDITPPTAKPTNGYFTVGSTKDEVQAVQGTPSRIEGNIWHYGLSWISFVGDRVTYYSNRALNLKISMMSKSGVDSVQTAGHFTIGSTKDEVLAVQGTPTSVNGSIWNYGLSWIEFDGDTVANYANPSMNLRIKIK